MKIHPFEDCVPVAGTISLSEGHFQAVGILMAYIDLCTPKFRASDYFCLLQLSPVPLVL